MKVRRTLPVRLPNALYHGGRESGPFGIADEFAADRFDHDPRTGRSLSGRGSRSPSLLSLTLGTSRFRHAFLRFRTISRIAPDAVEIRSRWFRAARAAARGAEGRKRAGKSPDHPSRRR